MGKLNFRELPYLFIWNITLLVWIFAELNQEAELPLILAIFICHPLLLSLLFCTAHYKAKDKYKKAAISIGAYTPLITGTLLTLYFKFTNPADELGIYLLAELVAISSMGISLLLISIKGIKTNKAETPPK